MAIHPAIESILIAAGSQPSIHPSTVQMEDRRRQYREMALAMWPAPTPVHEASDVQIPLKTGTIDARLYVPFGDEDRGLILYFHGGSFVLGDLETHDGLCRRLADDTKMRVLAIDYRLAPEHPFPAAIEDAIGTLRFVAEQMHVYANPSAKLIIMGDSAGGTLAAVAANSTRHDGIGLAGQVLIYPTLGPELLTNSAHDFATGFLLEVDHLRFDYQQYLGSWPDHSDPRVSPLMNLDLAESPPAVVVVAQYDPLRDEALSYAGLLEHFGTPVEILEAEGMTHGFLRLGGIIPDALAILDDLAEHLHRFVEVATP